MPAFIPSIYRYVQAVAESTWVITHNLATNGSDGVPIVDAYITVNGATQKVIPSSVTMNSPNQVTLVFNQAYAGEAIVIV